MRMRTPASLRFRVVCSGWLRPLTDRSTGYLGGRGPGSWLTHSATLRCKLISIPERMDVVDMLNNPLSSIDLADRKLKQLCDKHPCILVTKVHCKNLTSG
jgi:hypothetical protein